MGPNLYPGQHFNTVKFYKDILNYIKTRIVGGEGINVATMGDQIVLSVGKKSSPIGGIAETDVPRVPKLPELSEVTAIGKEYKVFWLSQATGILEGYDDSDVDHPYGTGDDQVWSLMYPQELWYPMQKATDRIGEPGT